jgi:hypothetical protein
MTKLMVVAEIRDGKPTSLTFELLGMARHLLAGDDGGFVTEADSVAALDPMSRDALLT